MNHQPLSPGSEQVDVNGDANVEPSISVVDPIDNGQIRAVDNGGANRGLLYRTITCVLLIVLPIFVASTFITFFLMKTTSLGNQNYLHEYAIYAFVIFSIASVFPFGLFFLVVLLEKVHSKYQRHVHGQDGPSIDGLAQSDGDVDSSGQEQSMYMPADGGMMDSRSSFSAISIFERYGHQQPDLIPTMAARREAIFIGDYEYGRNRRRSTLTRQDAFDCPPGYEDLELGHSRQVQLAIRRGGHDHGDSVVTLNMEGQEEEPPTYEVAIMCPMVTGQNGQTPKSAFRYKMFRVHHDHGQLTDDQEPPVYDEKTMKSWPQC